MLGPAQPFAAPSLPGCSGRLLLDSLAALDLAQVLAQPPLSALLREAAVRAGGPLLPCRTDSLLRVLVADAHSRIPDITPLLLAQKDAAARVGDHGRPLPVRRLISRIST